ncbi:MAG: membrane protein insertion efficiency factor YidD [Kiritimatiellaeota bacterium]|nr:membrane protein insertion efficiency factor YidD [Kiritimatiellota bacterium]
MSSLGRWLGLGLIWAYRNCVSPWKPPTCRFTPSCSVYAWEAVNRFGLIRGGWLSLRRMLRCHPFYHGPLRDPVPEPSECGTPTGLRNRHG